MRENLHYNFNEFILTFWDSSHFEKLLLFFSYHALNSYFEGKGRIFSLFFHQIIAFISFTL